MFNLYDQGEKEQNDNNFKKKQKKPILSECTPLMRQFILGEESRQEQLSKPSWSHQGAQPSWQLLWTGDTELHLLSAYYNACCSLPTQTVLTIDCAAQQPEVRTIVHPVDNALNASIDPPWNAAPRSCAAMFWHCVLHMKQTIRPTRASQQYIHLKF